MKVIILVALVALTLGHRGASNHQDEVDNSSDEYESLAQAVHALDSEEERDDPDCVTDFGITMCDVDSSWKCWRKKKSNPLADEDGTIAQAGFCNVPGSSGSKPLKCIHTLQKDGKSAWSCVWKRDID
jgi:hypothetical protein